VGTDPLLKIGPFSKASFGQRDRSGELRSAWVSGEDHLASHQSIVPEIRGGEYGLEPSSELSLAAIRR